MTYALTVAQWQYWSVTATVEENDNASVLVSMSWVNANIKKRKRVKKKSVKINLKFQMEENYKHIRKYPSGCCWLYCILPPAMSPWKLPPSDGRVSGPQNSCSFAALSTTFRTTTFGQLLCSACCFQEGSGSSDLFLLLNSVLTFALLQWRDSLLPRALSATGVNLLIMKDWGWSLYL